MFKKNKNISASILSIVTFRTTENAFSFKKHISAGQNTELGIGNLLAENALLRIAIVS